MLTAEQIVALSTAQVMVLETADLAAMTMTQYNAFEDEDWGVMSTAQFAALQSVTPIVLDLSGTGIHTTSAAHGVQFDLTGTVHAVPLSNVRRRDSKLEPVSARLQSIL